MKVPNCLFLTNQGNNQWDMLFIIYLGCLTLEIIRIPLTCIVHNIQISLPQNLPEIFKPQEITITFFPSQN